MKKSNFLVAAYLLVAGGMIGFTSCSNEEVIPNGGNGQDVQVLTLRVASSGDGLTTREGRPLLSSAADQSIDQVALYFVKDGKVALKKWVKWADTNDYADGKQLEIALKSDNGQKLKPGTYTVYAVGYSNASKYTFTPAAMANDNGNIFTESGDAWDAAAFKANMADPKFAEEVFAGELEVTVEADGSFKKQADGKKQAITLHRQVAGATGYFDNIPVAVDGKNAVKVRLVASARNATVKFENFNSAFTNSAAGNVRYIVNGADGATTKDAVFANGKDAFIVYEIDLSQWFMKDPSELGADYKGYDYNKDGFLGSDDVKKYLKDNDKDAATATIEDYAAVWKNPNKNLTVGGKEYTQSVYRGTVFGAQFVVPFAKVDGQNTLQLQVIDKEGAILKYWNVNVDKTHVQGDGDAVAGEAFDTDKKVFNIFRNHMYSVGMKADNTTPGNPDVGPTDPDPEKPTDPDPDKEDPQDLSKGQDLVIYVNDNWEVIHNMEID